MTRSTSRLRSSSAPGSSPVTREYPARQLSRASKYRSSLRASGGVTLDRPTVVIITTGGTIASRLDPATGGVVPAVSGEELVRAVPGLAEVANVEVRPF